MVGEQLAGARKASGLSLEDVARRTRIPATRLRALEAGMYELLPAPIFSRGFVRAYAAEVGLNPDELVHQYDAERPSAVPEPQTPAPGAALDDGGGAWSSWKGAALLAAGVAAVVFLIWSGRDPAGEALESPPSLQTGGPASAPRAVATTGHAAEPRPEGVSVALSADRVCWVTASADGQRVMYRLMQPGEKVALEGRDTVLLRAGDAGALTISVNGGAPQSLGGDGEVRTVTLRR
jgi:transcriptional regulator with XRE-family HTH domain